MSDPPWYTACPNPFLSDFVLVYGKPYDPKELYGRAPFAVDVSVGKTDQLYRAHGYHTKVPHLAIVPTILHYTEPGDIVLDGFAGSGMTGVAAQWCGSASAEYRRQLEAQRSSDGLSKPKWGTRRVILNDLGPAATFIAANYTIPFDLKTFARAAQQLLVDTEKELGWMYETLHNDGKTKGRINYTVWSEVFTCSNCTGEVNFLAAALDDETKRVHEEFPCPHCTSNLTKERMERLYETRFDPVIADQVRSPKRRPMLINYQVGNNRFEKAPDANDLALIERIAALPLPPEVPTKKLPYMHMTYERAHMDAAGITHVHHFFPPRASQSLAAMWRRAQAKQDARLRNMLLFVVEQAIWGMSLLNRYQPIQQGRPGGSQVNRQLSGIYYVSSQIAEASPLYNLTGKLQRLVKHAFACPYTQATSACTATGTCAAIGIPNETIDYIFTDPPFGEISTMPT